VTPPGCHFSGSVGLDFEPLICDRKEMVWFSQSIYFWDFTKITLFWLKIFKKPKTEIVREPSPQSVSPYILNF